MELKDEILSRYSNVDERASKFLERIITQLSLNKGNITDYARSLLDMLAVELILYFKSVDAMVEDDVLHTDNYKRTCKSPVIPVMQCANDKILNILDKLGLSPMSKAKIARLNNTTAEDNAKELLGTLLS